jgi:4-hydroxyproline epimerase
MVRRIPVEIVSYLVYLNGASQLRKTSSAPLNLTSRMQAISSPLPRSLRIVDSHTAGEPTRVVLPSGPEPDLGGGSLADRFHRLRTDYDHLRRAILCEPRGSDVLVGAWLLEPDDADCAAAVVFFNNTGYLGMCGHGAIGVGATLAHLGRIQPGEHRIQTPVGIVPIHVHTPNCVTIHNVPAFRHRAAVTVDVPVFGPVTGDVAWGGNWFFLVADHPFTLDKSAVNDLTAFTGSIRHALVASGVTGADGAEIDHIELFTAAHDPAKQSRNFVLCPGMAYDRSPCGTGTSAKLACLAADGKLQAGQIWRQEGILGTAFEGRFRIEDGRILPSITGSAWVTAESTLLFDPLDPFRLGIAE